MRIAVVNETSAADKNADILAALPDEVILPVLNYPGIRELIDVEAVADGGLRTALQHRL